METVLSTIEHSDIRKILDDYREVLKKDRIDTFNVFTITSDVYYRENYHSDILAAFLRHKDVRSGRYILLEAFMEMLNASRRNGEDSIVNDFLNPVIERERNRIDILIKDENTKRCIIIENKINDAVDMYRQLPRYYDVMAKTQQYQVDAIVYLTLTPDRLPNSDDWDKKDCDNIDCRLIPISVVNSDNKISLLANWVKPCLSIVADADVRIPLGQYGRLLETLSNEMNKIEKMKELNRLLQESGKNESVADEMFTLRGMMNLLPEAMADDLGECLRQHMRSMNLPFKISKWQPNSCVVNLDREDKIYVYCQFEKKEAYEIGVSDFSKPDRIPNWLVDKLDQPRLQAYSSHMKNIDSHDGLKYDFGYNAKSEVIDLIKNLISLYNDSNK